jgi:hypothetical protein
VLHTKGGKNPKKLRLANLNKEKPKGVGSPAFKGTVQQIDETGTVKAEYNGSTEILNAGFSPTGVSSVINGRQATHKGFVWKRKPLIT